MWRICGALVMAGVLSVGCDFKTTTASSDSTRNLDRFDTTKHENLRESYRISGWTGRAWNLERSRLHGLPLVSTNSMELPVSVPKANTIALEYLRISYPAADIKIRTTTVQNLGHRFTELDGIWIHLIGVNIPRSKGMDRIPPNEVIVLMDGKVLEPVWVQQNGFE